ncbi:unnamed protein product [Enterobius vermicularis]|uniref:Fe2OG dioxygenase domain-containing protein n=1 Tax=Enterobius vermicularis TaxID=51028 RepID=A0A0N4VG39_ENTVE|nr:unnamed protein product [Enterobius vermicularis]
MGYKPAFIYLYAFCIYWFGGVCANSPKLLAVTVATDETDGLRRLQRSAEAFHIDLHVFGLGEKWIGGDVRNGPGGGQKIRILQKHLKQYRDRQDVVVLFVDAFDVIFNGYGEEIMSRFLSDFKDYRVVFSAESFCWPDPELSEAYPLVQFGKRYLNSGLFMGYAPEIWKLINLVPVQDSDDDQLYYTRIYVDRESRRSLEFTLDSLSRIFQNLNGAAKDLSLEFKENDYAVLHNIPYSTHPLILHGNGPSKSYLNYLGNYLGKAWIENGVCQMCNLEETEVLEESDRESWPLLTIALLIAKPTPFVHEFLESFTALYYPTSRIHLFIYNNQKYNENEVKKFVQSVSDKYLSVDVENSDTDFGEREARTLAINCFAQVLLKHAFCKSLRLLLYSRFFHNFRGILAPLVVQPGKLFSNFWGAVAKDGYYARSVDYMEIVTNKKKGVWNVPFVSSALLINSKKFVSMGKSFVYNTNHDPDMSFCEYARDFGHFMYLDNQRHYGFLVVSENFDLTKLHPEMYQVFDNPELWESRYLHESYHLALNDNSDVITQPCPDVYSFPFMSKDFCEELIGEVEFFGQWSDGSNYDKRLAGGYENVPTRDIHMKQIDFERQWLYILDTYIRPIQEKIYIGYYHKPVEAYMMFVVRYKPDEQPSLRPHHDASTYSVDIALNKQGVDYVGGGVRFNRYNCSVNASEVGHSLIFPGRLTHLHEGLPTVSGTRYIAVSFINP